jgi:hypothetical protein
MDEEQNAGEFERDKSLAQASSLADALAAKFGTPDWSGLTALAKQLASDFHIADIELLTLAMTEGIAKGKVTSKEVFTASINNKIIILDKHNWDGLLETISLAALLGKELESLPVYLDEETTRQLASAINDFLARNVPASLILPEARKKGEAYAFVAVMAAYWQDLTGEPPVAYRDRNTDEHRGEFWRFVLTACAAVDIEPPSIQSVESWLREGKEWRTTTT